MKFYAIITTLFYISATAAVTEANNTQLLRGPRSAAAAADASNNNSLLLHAANQTRAAAAVSLEAATMATRLATHDVTASQVMNAAEDANGKSADSPSPIAALICNETDALLQVKYNITKDEFYSLDLDRSKFTPFLSVPDYTKYDWPVDNTVWYYSFLGLTDYEACLPRDECSRITVGGFPTDAYELSFDGKAVDIGDEILFNESIPVTATGVGNCATPICKDTEALLEAQFRALGSGRMSHPFLVQDKDGNTVLHGNTLFMDKYFDKTSVCLPKDNACYTFLIGGDYQSDSDLFKPWGESFPAHPSYSLSFDGKLVHRSESWLFDSVQFGDSCKSLCNEEDESLVEFFMFDFSQEFSLYLDVDDVPEVEYEYEWDLSIVNSSSSVSVSSGVVPQGPGLSPLFHKFMCIPKGSCSSFYFSLPNVTSEQYWLNPVPVYSLVMDNITYRKVELSSVIPNQTTNMGSCTVSGLCDEQTQDLFHLELRTPAKYEDPHASSFPASSINYYDVSWNFENDHVWLSEYSYDAYSYNEMGYELNSSFGVIECVPKDGCDFSFNIGVDSPVESYAVKKNGVQLDTQETNGYVVTTPFGQNCFPSNSSLSGGAIAGIVIACVVAVGAVVFGLVSYKRRQRSQSSKEGEENPLHESLL